MPLRVVLSATFLALALFAAPGSRAGAADTFPSSPPQRPLPVPSARPLGTGSGIFVDPQRGDDANDGTKERPWRTIRAALPRLNPGDTLYLRGGQYFETVYCAVAGTAEKPITIRSYPGELAVIDGGIPDFQRDPASA